MTANTNKWLLISQLDSASTHFPNVNLNSCGVTFYYPPAPLPNQDKWKFNNELNQDGKIENY